MNYPWELYAAALAQLLPVLGGLPYARSLPAPRRWFVLWCLLSVLADAVWFFFGRVAGENLWLRIITVPTRAAVLFWVLSLWQVSTRARDLMRRAILVLIPVTLVIALVWEGTSSFGDKSGPILQLAQLAACVYTLVSLDYARSLPVFRRQRGPRPRCHGSPLSGPDVPRSGFRVQGASRHPRVSPHDRRHVMSASPQFVVEAYIASGVALGLLVFALGAALVLDQRPPHALPRPLDECLNARHGQIIAPPRAAASWARGQTPPSAFQALPQLSGVGPFPPRLCPAPGSSSVRSTSPRHSR